MSVNWVISGSSNGLAPVGCQAITYSNNDLLLISEILIKIWTFSFKKIHLKLLSAIFSIFFKSSMSLVYLTRLPCLRLYIYVIVSSHSRKLPFIMYTNPSVPLLDLCWDYMAFISLYWPCQKIDRVFPGLHEFPNVMYNRMERTELYMYNQSCFVWRVLHKIL